METTGDLIFLSDQDDVWFPEKIEHMLAVAERNPKALLVMNDAALTDGELNEVGLTKVGQIRSAGFPMESFVMGCCCGVRRELLELCMPIPVGFKGHDDWLVGFAGGLAAKLVDEKVLQYYRRHESNESQFIANRTTKVTRNLAFLHSLQNIVHKEAKSRARAQVEQLRIFSDGVGVVEARAPEKYREKLAELKSRTEQKVELVENRLAVREKWFLPRIIAAGGLFAKGGYQHAAGIKSVLRDILG